MKLFLVAAAVLAAALAFVVAAQIPQAFSLGNSVIANATPTTVANGGTGANLSATGGASNYLQQSSTGAAVTVGKIAFADLPVFPSININSGAFVVSSGVSTATKYATVTCASAASPAVCGFATAGYVSIPAAGTSIVVDTLEVTAASEIFVIQDASASTATALGVTCYSAANTAPWISARTAGTSFTITSTAPSVNPSCLSFFIIN
jgi:hypothetical protein